MIYTKWCNLISCCALSKNCDWFRQITPLSNLTQVNVASRGMKTYSEARIELRNLQFLKRMLEKSSQFLSLDQPMSRKAWMFPEYCRSWKIRSENLRLRSTWRPFDSSFERKGALLTVDICVPCGRWFSNQFEIVSETPFSCDTVGCELLLAVFYSLLCRETDWNICIGKQGYLFNVYFIWFYVFWCFAFLTSISVSRISCDWEKLNLLNESIS